MLSRNKTGVFFPIPLRNLAEVRDDTSFVTSNSPHAPAAFAWTTLQRFGWLEEDGMERGLHGGGREQVPFWDPLAVEMSQSLDEKSVS